MSDESSMKRVTWQGENCLACVWFKPNDPLNADILERGLCTEPKLKAFGLVVSGRTGATSSGKSGRSR